jgi:hypothetical protein
MAGKVTTPFPDEIAPAMAALMAGPIEWGFPSNIDKRLHGQTNLYFIQSGDFTKVGITSWDVEARFSALQAGNPHPMRIHSWRRIPWCFDKVIERRCHEILAPYSVGREWFRVSPRIASRVATPLIQSAEKRASQLREIGLRRLLHQFPRECGVDPDDPEGLLPVVLEGVYDKENEAARAARDEALRARAVT